MRSEICKYINRDWTQVELDEAISEFWLCYYYQCLIITFYTIFVLPYCRSLSKVIREEKIYFVWMTSILERILGQSNLSKRNSNFSRILPNLNLINSNVIFPYFVWCFTYTIDKIGSQNISRFFHSKPEIIYLFITTTQNAWSLCCLKSCILQFLIITLFKNILRCEMHNWDTKIKQVQKR